MWLLIEAFLAIVAVAIALRFPHLGARWFVRAEKACGELARRQWLAVAVSAVLPVATRLILLPFMPAPVLEGVDELSYLLAADTFAHGRLANPPHPMWMHFESINILQHPTYASMYFPVQGLFLAAGLVAFGSPWAGVLISVGLMCGAICWMLQGWLPPRWALLGGLLAAIRLGVFSYWANYHAGGAVTALGGALVLGALPRIKRHQRVRDALLMAIGLVILANSRPYEGLVFSLPIGIALLVWMLGKKRPSLGVSIPKIVVPVVLVLAIAAAAMGYYNWRVTGNPFLMPEQLNQDMYHSDRFFLWQSPKPPPYIRHKEMRDYDRIWLREFQATRTVRGVVLLTWKKMVWLWFFFLGPALTLPILALAAIVPYGYTWARLSVRLRFLLGLMGITIIGLLPEFYFNPHYLAASAGLILALVLMAMRYLRLWEWRGRPSGLFLVRSIPLICAVMAILYVGAQPMRITFAPPWPQAWCSAQPNDTGRSRILQELMRTPGRHLVVVRYSLDHNPDVDWVYNDADIDSAKVVWARAMDEAHDCQLLEYFRDRQVWLAEPDESPPRLSVYASSCSR